MNLKPFLVAIVLCLPLSAQAQTTIVTHGTSAPPTTCALGGIYERTGSTLPGLYVCLATNVWTGPTTITGSDTQVCFNDSGALSCGDAGLVYTKVDDFLYVLGGLVIDADTPTDHNYLFKAPATQLYVETKLAGTDVYMAASAFASTIENTNDDAAAVLTAMYWDGYVNITHNALLASGHDLSSYPTVTAGKTVGTFAGTLTDVVTAGGGTITDFSGLTDAPQVAATQITTGSNLRLDLPNIVGGSGGAIGTWYAIRAQDLSGLTVGTAKGFINYGAGKFLVDSAGGITTTDSVISPLYSSSTAKVLLRGTGTGATQVAMTQTTAPTCTTNCGSGSPTVVGTDTAGIITLGTTPASGFVVVFNGTWAAAPACLVQMAKAGMAGTKSPLTIVSTTGQFTVVTTSASPSTGDMYQYHCFGRQ